MTYQDSLVVDAVSHAYNLGPSNWRNKLGEILSRALMEQTQGLYNREDSKPPRERYFGDVTAEDLSGLYFQESDVDFTVYHAVGIFGWHNQGMSPLPKGLKLRDMHPDRVAVYGCVDPLDRDALDEMERQVNELGVDGMKFYPASYRNEQYHRIAFNDGKTGQKFLDKAVDLGVSNVAVHKVIPLVSTPTEMVQVEDIDEVAPSYPELNFEIVHAGFSFLEDSLYLISSHPNVYANLEATHGLMYSDPHYFGESMGKMIKWAGPDKLLMATGTLSHPQAVVEDFWDYQIPDELQSKHNLPAITDEMKKKILGRNAARVLGKDPDKLQKKLGDHPAPTPDERPQPWSSFSIKEPAAGD